VEPKLEVYWEQAHGDAPVLVSSPDEVDALLDRVRDEYTERWPVLLELSLVDDWDHLLNVGVCGEMGVLFWSGKELPGRWYSKGDDTEQAEESTYYYMGNNREFPAGAEVPLAVVKLAVREFLATEGLRPTSAEWKEDIIR
jgi:Immunity protein Imm1